VAALGWMRGAVCGAAVVAAAAELGAGYRHEA
jgi:hypothetical protein